MPPEQPAPDSVTVSIPLETLESIRQMVGQLSAAIEDLSAQAGQSAEPTSPAAPMAPTEGEGGDAAFLADMAREGSIR